MYFTYITEFFINFIWTKNVEELHRRLFYVYLFNYTLYPGVILSPYFFSILLLPFLTFLLCLGTNLTKKMMYINQVWYSHRHTFISQKTYKVITYDKNILFNGDKRQHLVDHPHCSPVVVEHWQKVTWTDLDIVDIRMSTYHSIVQCSLYTTTRVITKVAKVNKRKNISFIVGW